MCSDPTDPAWEEYMSTGIDPTGGELGPDFDPGTGRLLSEIEEEEAAEEEETDYDPEPDSWPRIMEHFGLTELDVYWYDTENDDPVQVEHELLAEVKAEYGQLPPWNSIVHCHPILNSDCHRKLNS